MDLEDLLSQQRACRREGGIGTYTPDDCMHVSVAMVPICVPVCVHSWLQMASGMHMPCGTLGDS